MNRVFYADGSTLGNGTQNAVGAYACVEVTPDECEELVSEVVSCGPSEIPVTNIRMELLAVILALHHCDPCDTVIIKTDSAYVVNGMNEKWYEKWARTGVTSSNRTPKNLDLWRELIRASRRVEAVKFEHVKGHDGLKWNERCDKLARTASEKFRADKYSAERTPLYDPDL